MSDYAQMDRDRFLEAIMNSLQKQEYQNLSPEHIQAAGEYKQIAERQKVQEQLLKEALDAQKTPMPTATQVKPGLVADPGGGINAGLQRMQGGMDAKKARSANDALIGKKDQFNADALRYEQDMLRGQAEASQYNAIPAGPSGMTASTPRQQPEDPISSWLGNQYDPSTGANRGFMDEIINVLRKSGMGGAGGGRGSINPPNAMP
jgi:hypothetical protein